MSKMIMNISKSKYVKAVQCPKINWMDAYKSTEHKVDENVESVFRTGNEVGDLARSYFGDYSLVEYESGIGEMLRDTEKFMKLGVTNIAEASFHIDHLFCSVDILHKNDIGYDIVEVKSSTETKDIYLDDMAFQYYVLNKAGIPITGVYNMYINSNYVRRGELDLKQLFILDDYTETVLNKQEEVKNNIDEFFKYMEKSKDIEPEQDITTSCFKPYECPYKDYCLRNVETPSVFDVRGLKKSRMVELYHNGIVTFEDVVKQGVKLSKKQKLQVETEYFNSPPTIDKAKIKECIESFAYPLYFLDFETYQDAIPKYDEMRPYAQIPFQYSLHVLESKDAELEHFEFLAKEGTDPRRALAEQLCKEIPLDVCTLAYNMKFEKMVIESLADIYPDLHDHLMNICANIKDLMIPFSTGDYYNKALEGSYSIKYVLPVLCPNDSELDYHSLDGIHNGGEAMEAFPDLLNHTKEEREQIRKNLLAYCRLDTLAMVKILEKLKQMI